MSDLLYDIIWHIGFGPVWAASKPTLLNRERLARTGGYILASTHLSPYDIPLLMYASNERRLDFVSIVELFENPFVATLFGALNVFALDRSRPDPLTVKAIVDRLKGGRVVAMFPEGYLRNEQTSALNGGPIKAGFARIARMAGVPVVPVVAIGSTAFHQLPAHLPLRRTRWGVAVGEAIEHDASIDEDQDVDRMTESLRRSWYGLRDELRQAMGEKMPEDIRGNVPENIPQNIAEKKLK